MPARLRLAALALALLIVPASAEAGTILSVPVAGGGPSVLGRDPGAYFDTPCRRADGAVLTHAEREKGRRYGIFRPGAAPRWLRVEGEVVGAAFAPGCDVVAEVHYAFDDDPQYDGGILIRKTGGKAIMRVKSRQWPEGVTLAWSRDGNRLAVVMNERGRVEETLRVIDVPKRRVIARQKAVDSITVWPEAFSPDGGALVYEDGSRLRVLDVTTRKSRVLAGGADGRLRTAPAWSPKGDRIAAVNDGGGIELLDPALGYGPTIPTAEVETESLAWSPDGATLALYVGGRTIDRSGLAVVAASPDARVQPLLEPRRDLGPPIWSADGTALIVTRRG